MPDAQMMIVRGGGDLASGVAHTLFRAGFPVVVLELAQPRAIRRTVSFARAVEDGQVTIDALDPVSGRLVSGTEEAISVTESGEVAVLVHPGLPVFDPPASVVVDARLAKHNIDTTIADALLVIGLGPGFTAGEDCHAVIETMRGHRLGRVLWRGRAAPDTGVPGSVGGATAGRVVRAPAAGRVEWKVEIGDIVEENATIGRVGDAAIVTGIGGVVRGLISAGYRADPGLKIADVDPRSDPAACFEISDKARLVGAGVLQAVLQWRNR